MAQIGSALPDFLNPTLYQKAANDDPALRRPVKPAAKTRFSSLLEKVSGEHRDALEHTPASEEAIADLLDEVHSAGDMLTAKPFPDEIKRYKTAVRSFMSYVLENGFSAEDEEGVPDGQKPGFKGLRGSPEARNRKVHTQIKVIDDKLEKLAADILNGQLKQLDLLHRVEEINGLLINILE